MIDWYTKAVLTVIAVALVALVGQNAVRPSVAQSLTRVAICDLEEHCPRMLSFDNGRTFHVPTSTAMDTR